MSKLRVFGKKSAATVATAAALGSNTAASLFPQGSNTAASLYGTLNWLLSLLKPTFYSRVCRIGSNTFPNFAQELEIRSSWELGDEFDHEDYDEWWDERPDQWDWDYDNYGRMCWERRAVDEAIAEEENDNSIGDIPF